MRPLRMVGRQAGVEEIAGGIVAHAEPFHDGARPAVAAGREGDDLGAPERAEAVGERAPRRLGGVAAAPRFERQPPQLQGMRRP